MRTKALLTAFMTFTLTSPLVLLELVRFFGSWGVVAGFAYVVTGMVLVLRSEPGLFKWSMD